MKKTLLALFTAGTMSCGSNFYPIVSNPVELRPNELEFLEHKYENSAGMNCSRLVYAGFQEGQLQSVLQVEHCLTGETEGSFGWKRSEDNNGDGLVDQLCMNKGQSYIGSKTEVDAFPKCETNSAYNISSRISLVFFDALWWARRARNP